MFDNWGARGRILAVLAVPLAVLMVISGFATTAAAHETAAAHATEQVVEVARAAHDLLLDLQVERDAGSNFVDALPWALETRATARENTDAQYEAVVAAAEAAPPSVQAEARDALAAIDAILNGSAGLAFVRATDVVISPMSVRAMDDQGNPLTGEDSQPVWVTVGYEWPVWPDATSMRDVEAMYGDLENGLGGVADRTPAETGMAAAIERLSQLIGVEATATVNLLTSPETEVRPEFVSSDSVLPPAPIWVATYQEAFAAAAADVDVRASQLRSDVDGLDARGTYADTRAALEEALALLDGLEGTRSSVKDRSESPAEVAAWYTTVINGLLESESATAVSVPNTAVAQAVTAYGVIDALVEAMRQEEMVAQRAIRRGAWVPPEGLELYVGLKARTDAALLAATEAVDRVPDVAPIAYGASFSQADQTGFIGIRTDIVMSTFAPGQAARSAWAMQVDEEVASFQASQAAVWDEVKAASAGATRDATRHLILIVLAAAASVFASLWIALVVARRSIGMPREASSAARQSAKPPARVPSSASARPATRGKASTTGKSPKPGGSRSGR